MVADPAPRRAPKRLLELVAAPPWHGITIDLPALPKFGPLSWWHLVVGMARYARNRGDGIKIGVIDTGVGPHPYLSHVKRLGSTAGGKYNSSPEAGADVEQHGTHVSGIIAAVRRTVRATMVG